MLPVSLQLLGAGSYSSALLRKAPLMVLYPPATRTLPEPSSAAVCHQRATSMLPVAVHAPAPLLPAGSYSSALLTESLPSHPPATRTFPESSSVAVCDWRATAMLPVPLQVPVAGSYSCALFK